MKINSNNKEINTLFLLFTQEEIIDLCNHLEQFKENKATEIDLEYKDKDGRFCKQIKIKLTK